MLKLVAADPDLNGGPGVGRAAAAPPPPAPARVVKAPLRWRLRNRLRMLLTAELLLPAWVWLLRKVGPRGVTFAYGELRGVVTRADGTAVDYGLLGRHLVVTAGKNYLAACFPNTNEPENLKYHGFGSGSAAAAAGDTALQTEYTTEYAVNSTRPTGSQSSSTNTYTTAATFSPDATVTASEWGLLSQAATGGGTLFDRQVFSGVPLTGSSDSLTTTYVLTIS